MITECQEREKIAGLQAGSWSRGEFNVAKRLLLELNDHERNCPKCRAIREGVGLAAGLFHGAKVVEVES